MTEAKEVKSAEEATRIAQAFIRKHYAFTRPIKGVRQGDVWLVDIDVGMYGVRIVKVKIDAKTSTILEYELPS